MADSDVLNTVLSCGHIRPGLGRGQLWCDHCQDFASVRGWTAKEATARAGGFDAE